MGAHQPFYGAGARPKYKKLKALHSRISNSIHFVFINLKFRIVRGGYCQRGVYSLSCLYPPLTQSYLILFLKIVMLDIENFDSFDSYMDYIESIYAPNDVELLNEDNYE